MTAELGDAPRQRTNDRLERVQLDGSGESLAMPVPAIETAVVSNALIAVPKDRTCFGGQRTKQRHHGRGAMDMLVRVNVSRVSSHELAKPCELSAELEFHSADVFGINHGIKRRPTAVVIQPLAEIDVQPQAELGVVD